MAQISTREQHISAYIAGYEQYRTVNKASVDFAGVFNSDEREKNNDDHSLASSQAGLAYSRQGFIDQLGLGGL